MPAIALQGTGPQLPAQHLQLVRVEGAAPGGGAPAGDRRQHPKVSLHCHIAYTAVASVL